MTSSIREPYVLGLDLSTNSWTIALVYVPSLDVRVSDYSFKKCFPNIKKATGEERLLHLADRFKNVLDYLVFDPPVLAGIELMSHPRNARTNRLLVAACEYARLRLHDAGIPTLMVHNQSWKAQLTPAVRVGKQGDRSQQKMTAKDAVHLLYSELLETTTQDEIDAIAIGRFTALHWMETSYGH